MEILLIFLGFMLAIIIMMLYEIKLRKPRNKVHFYVARDKKGMLWLYSCKPIRFKHYWDFEPNVYGGRVYPSFRFKDFGLNIDDYKDLKWEDELVEVLFLN